MKAFKLGKEDLKSNDALLRKAGALYGNKAFPSHVYLSKEDYKILETNVRKELGALSPGMGKKRLDYLVNIEMANLGPNEIYAKVLRPGFALVDDVSIQADLLAEEEAGQKAADESVANMSTWVKVLSINPFNRSRA